MNINNSVSQLEDQCHQKLVNQYFGNEGFLKIRDETEINCKFEVGQLEDGKIILSCECSVLEIYQKLSSRISSVKLPLATCKKLIGVDCLLPENQKKFIQLEKISCFEGITSNGLNITGKVSICSGIDIRSLKDPYIRLQYHLKELKVSANQEKIKSFVFDVTNFKLLFEDMKIDTKDVKNLIIKKKKEYDNAVKYLENCKGIRVTCEVIIEIDNEIDLNNIENMVCDLCDLMSIAMGTRIQWISYGTYNSEKEFVLRKHASRVTKPYNSMEIIKYKNFQAMKTFIESSYVALSEKSNINSKILRYEENSAKPLVNAYLDAKAESDYLEGRGVKLAVVLEMLKDAYLKSNPNLEYIIKKKTFKKLYSTIQSDLTTILKQNSDFIDPNLIDLFCKNISALNRTPFYEVLRKLCESISLNIDTDDIKLVKKSRDNLIHTGQFLCESGKKETKRFQNPIDEYLFLVTFIDKCFLKLLCYKGEYLDWSKFENVHPEILS